LLPDRLVDDAIYAEAGRKSARNTRTRRIGQRQSNLVVQLIAEVSRVVPGPKFVGARKGRRVVTQVYRIPKFTERKHVIIQAERDAASVAQLWITGPGWREIAVEHGPDQRDAVC